MFIENPTPFFEEFLHKFLALSYPKDKIHLYIHNGVGLSFSLMIYKIWFFKIYKPFYVF